MTLCPGCGEPFERVRKTQTYCRPSCGARHHHRESQRLPNVFNGLTLDSEWPGDDDDDRRRTRENSER